MKRFMMFQPWLDQWMQPPAHSAGPGKVVSLARRREVRTVLCLIAFFGGTLLSRAILSSTFHWEGPIGFPFSAIIAGVVLAVLLSWVWYSDKR